MKTLIIVCLLCLTPMTYAQVPYGTPGSTYTQDFNWTSTGSAASQTVGWVSNASTQAVTTVNWNAGASSLGWYAGSHQQDSANFRVGNGTDTANAGSTINNYFWASGDSDRSFGGRPTGTIPMNLALRLNNATGLTLDEFTLGYRLEVTHWRANGNHATASVSYFVGNPTDWRTDSFISAPALNLSTVYGGNTAATDTNVNGNNPGNFNILAPTTITGINWTPGADLWIRWTFNVGTSLPNVGLDDVRFTAVPEPGAAALLGLGGLGLLALLRRRG